jgi:hypothetical protein
MSEAKQYYWNADRWEATFDDFTDLIDGTRSGDVVRVGRAVALPEVWVVLCEQGKTHQFDTKAAALAFSQTAARRPDNEIPRGNGSSERRQCGRSTRVWGELTFAQQKR